MSYAYQAEMICDDCCEDLKWDLNKQGIKDTGDTNDYPQFANSDEADSPQHCAFCKEFLANSLTTDGQEYVKQAIAEAIERDDEDCIAWTEWRTFYDVTVYSAGWNMPGYMPDNPPARFVEFDEAKRYIIEVMKQAENEASEAGDEDEATELCHAAEDVNLESDEFSVNAGKYVYFIDSV